MADLEKTVKVLFLGEDQISKTIGDIGSKIDVFSSTVESIANPLAGVADSILKTDAALVAMATGGLVYSVLKFRDFEDVMLKVRGVLGANEEEYRALMDVTKELGATTRYTATEAAQGLEFLALAGFSTTDAIGAIPEVLQLAQASALDLGRAADIVTNIMAGYGIQVQDLSRANDVLTATFTNSNTNLDQLGDAFKFVGPVAKSLGLDISETAAILGTLGNAGYQAEMGGTALRNILLALVAPAGNMGKLMKELGVNTEELGVDLASSRNALESLGVSVKDSEGKLRPFTDIMDQIKVGLEKIPDPADRAATLIEIFGKRGGPQLAALLEQGSGAVRGLQDKINSLGGITAEIADQMESGMGGALRSFKSALEAISITIGEQLSDALEGTVRGATEIERVLNQMIEDGTFDPVFRAVENFGDDLERLLREVAKNLPEAFDLVDFTGIERAFQNLQIALGGIFDGVDLTTLEGLAAGIQKVVDVGRMLVNVTAGMIESITPFFNQVEGMGESFSNLDDKSQLAAGNILGLAKAVSEAGLKIAVAVIAIGDLADDLAPIFKIVINTVSGLFDGVVLLWNTAKLAFVEILDDMLAASKTFSTFFLFGAFGEQIDAARANLSVWKNDLKNDMHEAAESATKHLTGITVDFDKVGSASNRVEQSIKTSMDQAGKSMETAQGKAESLFIAIPEEKTTSITADVDESAIKTAALSAWNYIETTLPDGSVKRIDVVPEADKTAAKDAKDEIDKEIPAVKAMEIQAELDVAKLKAVTDILGKGIEWSARIDIAQIEADAEIAKAAFESIGESVSAVAESVASMFGDLSDYSGSHFYELYDILDRQVDIEAELAAAQIRMLDARTDAYKNGTAGQIIVQGGDLEPGAKVFMEEVLKYVQMQVFDSGDQLLLGTPSS